MATIKKQDVVNNFHSYVRDTANASILWHAGTKPFTDFPASYLQGSASGLSSTLNTADLPTTKVDASDIYDSLLAEANRYTSIRNLNAKLNVTGSGNTYGSGNSSPAGCAKGIIFNQTKKTFMSNSQLQNIASVAKHGTNAGSTVFDGVGEDGLEDFYIALKSAYTSKRDTTLVHQVDVCHCSCHSNCHSSRGRR